ncbi:hypothetical protein evm_010433 [Chilo suppressalis]|nr:hypothetical protein evm_010433 [Chilo suppressalis]
MKPVLLLLILTCVLINAQNGSTTKKPGRTITKSYRYITNWSSYGIPEKIEIEKLKEILTAIAKFKRLEYCPHGDKEKCEERDFKGIVTAIVKNAVGNTTVDEKINKSLRNGLIYLNWLINGDKEISTESASDEDLNDTANENYTTQVLPKPCKNETSTTPADQPKPKAVLELKYLIFK